MKRYSFEIEVSDGKGGKVFKKVHPTNGEPYSYDTESEAYDSLNLYYPDRIAEEGRIIDNYKEKETQADDWQTTREAWGLAEDD